MHCVRKNKKRRLTMHTLQRCAPDMRVLLLMRSHGACWYCGTPLTLRTVTADHIVPVQQGGQAVLENMVASCSACNREKGHRSLDEFRQWRGVAEFWGEAERSKREE